MSQFQFSVKYVLYIFLNYKYEDLGMGMLGDWNLQIFMNWSWLIFYVFLNKIQLNWN